MVQTKSFLSDVCVAAATAALQLTFQKKKKNYFRKTVF